MPPARDGDAVTDAMLKGQIAAKKAKITTRLQVPA
jgi:hypothetical protein